MRFSLLLCLMLFSGYLRGQEAVPQDTLSQKKTKFEAWVEKLMNRGFMAAPSVSYAPETRFSVGIGGYWYFRTAKDSITRPSSLQFAAVYTQNKQLSMRVPFQMAFAQNKYLLQAEVGYYKYPYQFFGVGNQIDLDSSELYTPHILRLRAGWLWQVKKNLFIGPKWRYEWQEIVKSVPGGMLEAGNVPGKEGGTLSAFGAELLYDTRNNLFSPRKGIYINFLSYQSLKALGATYQGNTATADLRCYIPLWKQSTLAFQAYGAGITGRPPFFLMSQLGGYYRMRGYFNGAYRDKYFACLQAEMRLHLIDRLGVVAFASLGQVSRRIALEPDYLRPAGGIGLRFMFNTKERINMRLDYAIGKGSRGFYAAVSEAF